MESEVLRYCDAPFGRLLIVLSFASERVCVRVFSYGRLVNNVACARTIVIALLMPVLIEFTFALALRINIWLTVPKSKRIKGAKSVENSAIGK